LDDQVVGPVWTWQRKREFTILLDLYRQLDPRKSLEIGTMAGGSLYGFLQASTAGCTVFSVDPYDTVEGPEGVIHHDNRHLYPSWCPPGVEVVAIEGDSHDELVVDMLHRERPFDFVFLDGDHTHAGVLLDWVIYSPMVRPGGLVVINDIVIPSAAEAWAHIRRRGDWETWEIVSDPTENWGGYGIARM
jgi:predicted O-methyltransferase YrrM